MLEFFAKMWKQIPIFLCFPSRTYDVEHIDKKKIKIFAITYFKMAK